MFYIEDGEFEEHKTGFALVDSKSWFRTAMPLMRTYNVNKDFLKCWDQIR